MNRLPAPVPAAALIKLTRKGAGISIHRAAELGGVSEVRWMQVEKGSETRQRQVRPARPKPEFIAAMAAGVNRAAGTVLITPERLGGEGQAAEAAGYLRESLRQDAARRPPPAAPPPAAARVLSPYGPGAEAAVAVFAVPIERARGEWRTRYASEHPGVRPGDIPPPPGADLFGAGTREAGLWDSYVTDMAEEEVVWLVATIRATRAAGSERNRPAGTAGA
jgi:transcriptional regulator with XRE-family HTH domain